MSNFRKLIESGQAIIEVIDNDEEIGVARVCNDNYSVKIYRGRGNGEDDIIISKEAFNEKYRILKVH